MGVTEHMSSGGNIEIAQRIAEHTSPTTRIYDRSMDRLTLEEIERVQIGEKRYQCVLWRFELILARYIQNSPEFARRPLGVFIDPDKMVAAREAGASSWDLHKRAWQGEFEPAHPYNPAAVL